MEQRCAAGTLSLAVCGADCRHCITAVQPMGAVSRQAQPLIEYVLHTCVQHNVAGWAVPGSFISLLECLRLYSMLTLQLAFAGSQCCVSVQSILIDHANYLRLAATVMHLIQHSCSVFPCPCSPSSMQPQQTGTQTGQRRKAPRCCHKTTSGEPRCWAGMDHARAAKRAGDAAWCSAPTKHWQLLCMLARVCSCCAWPAYMCLEFYV